MGEKTEREKMLAGELYLASDLELKEMRAEARRLMEVVNTSRSDEITKQQSAIRELFAQVGETFYIEPPFYCDYGCHIYAGENLYINYDRTIQNCAVDRKSVV